MRPQFLDEFKKRKIGDVTAENLLWAMSEFPQLNMETSLPVYVEMLKYLADKRKKGDFPVTVEVLVKMFKKRK